MTDLVTIRDVEIGSVGMKWPAQYGDFTLTTQNLVDVMTAANDDPHVVTPRLKIGHEGWPDDHGLDTAPLFGTSAEPAFGRVTNFRLTNDGATLVGDYVDVPAWLLAAYPSRSGEWAGAVDPVFQTGVITPGGKHYSIVLTAVALLGVAVPALADIEDLESFLTTGTTKAGNFTVTTTGEDRVPTVATRADIDTVQRSFWADFADGDYFWWWPRDIYTDPNEVLADDDEGHLYRVPFTSADDGQVTWGDPVRVRIDLVDLPDPSPAAVATAHRAIAATTAHMHRTFATAAEARPAERHTQRSAEQVAAATQAETGHDTEEDDAMTGIDISALRERLGLTDEQLPDDATPEQVNAAFAIDPPDPQAQVTESETPETPEVTEPDAIDAAKDAALAATAKRVEELEAKEAARETSAATERRDTVANTAVREGKFAPAERDHYRELLDINEERATALIEALPKGRVPVTETGLASTSESQAPEGLPTHWFPQLQDRTSTTITQEA